MNSAAVIILFLVSLSFVLPKTMAIAQSPTNLDKPPSQQWLSHQMFQPPPEDFDKKRLSEETIEEIKRLYMEAESEQRARKENKAK